MEAIETGTVRVEKNMVDINMKKVIIGANGIDPDYNVTRHFLPIF